MKRKLSLRTAAGIRLFVVLAAISLCGIQTTRAQTSYSDMWVSNTPSAVSSTDETAQAPVDETDSDQATLNGTGVTEGDYTSYNEYQTETRIQSPLGTLATATGSTGAWSRADVSLSVNLSSPEEGDYALETQHTKYTYDGSGGPTQVTDNPIGHHSSKYKNMRSVAANPIPPFGLFSWVKRLIGSVRAIKIVYQYSSSLQVGPELRYYYTLVCQRPFCRADTVKSWPSTKFGGVGVRPPSHMVIRGINISINLLITRIHACVGKSFASGPTSCS